MRAAGRGLAGLLLAALASAAAAEPGFARVFPQLAFDNPLFVTAAPGAPKRLYVVTQKGQVFFFATDPEPRAAQLFADLRDRVTQRGGEEGLLGLAFHPDFAQNRTFFVYYTPADSPRRTVLSRFTARSADGADPASEKVLLTIAQPYSNHNGGMLAFGPDRQLYLGVGDGGSAGDPRDNGQSLETLLGKLLRVTEEGKAPADNPFVNLRGARPEIWAYGLRNPWRFSFDRQTGALWLADVGQNKWEEIDRIDKGGNYGWRVYEGAKPFRKSGVKPVSGFIRPVATYGHDDGCSVTGGYVYRGASVPALQGHYLYADFCSGKAWAFDTRNPGFPREIGPVPDPSSFGEDEDGEVYVTSFDGHLYRLVAKAP